MIQSEIFVPISDKVEIESSDCVIHYKKNKNNESYTSGDSASSDISNRLGKN